MDWVIPYGKGRVYTTMLGHLWKDGPDTAMRCVGFQTLLIRGCEWAATGKVTTYPIPKDFPTARRDQSCPTAGHVPHQDEEARRQNQGEVQTRTRPHWTFSAKTVLAARRSRQPKGRWPKTSRSAPPPWRPGVVCRLERQDQALRRSVLSHGGNTKRLKLDRGGKGGATGTWRRDQRCWTRRANRSRACPTRAAALRSYCPRPCWKASRAAWNWDGLISTGDRHTLE